MIFFLGLLATGFSVYKWVSTRETEEAVVIAVILCFVVVTLGMVTGAYLGIKY